MREAIDTYKTLSTHNKQAIRRKFEQVFQAKSNTWNNCISRNAMPPDIAVWLIDELEALGLAPDGTPVKRKTQAAA